MSLNNLLQSKDDTILGLAKFLKMLLKHTRDAQTIINFENHLLTDNKTYFKHLNTNILEYGTYSINQHHDSKQSSIGSKLFGAISHGHSENHNLRRLILTNNSDNIAENHIWGDQGFKSGLYINIINSTQHHGCFQQGSTLFASVSPLSAYIASIFSSNPLEKKHLVHFEANISQILAQIESIATLTDVSPTHAELSNVLINKYTSSIKSLETDIKTQRILTLCLSFLGSRDTEETLSGYPALSENYLNARAGNYYKALTHYSCFNEKKMANTYKWQKEKHNDITIHTLHSIKKSNPIITLESSLHGGHYSNSYWPTHLGIKSIWDIISQESAKNNYLVSSGYIHTSPKGYDIPLVDEQDFEWSYLLSSTRSNIADFIGCSYYFSNEKLDISFFIKNPDGSTLDDPIIKFAGNINQAKDLLLKCFTHSYAHDGSSIIQHITDKINV